MRAWIVAFVMGCGSTPSHAPPSPAPGHADSAMSCPDESALKAYANQGRTCTVTGVYSMKQFRGKGGVDLGTWPIVTLADGSQVMLESLHDPSKRPGAATVEGFRDRRVHARGTLHSQPPRDMPANFFHWTLSPVTSIELARQ